MKLVEAIPAETFLYGTECSVGERSRLSLLDSTINTEVTAMFYVIYAERQFHVAGIEYRATYLEFSIMNFRFAMIVVR